MTDKYEDLIQLLAATGDALNAGGHHGKADTCGKAATAIKELVADYKGQGEALIKEVNAKLEAQVRAEKAERECVRLGFVVDAQVRRAEKAEADLVAARKALRKIDGWSRVHTLANMQAIQAEANAAIAAARAEGGE